jgi:hypothetical protein
VAEGSRSALVVLRATTAAAPCKPRRLEPPHSDPAQAGLVRRRSSAGWAGSCVATSLTAAVAVPAGGSRQVRPSGCTTSRTAAGLHHRSIGRRTCRQRLISTGSQPRRTTRNWVRRIEMGRSRGACRSATAAARRSGLRRRRGGQICQRLSTTAVRGSAAYLQLWNEPGDPAYVPMDVLPTTWWRPMAVHVSRPQPRRTNIAGTLRQ